MFEFNREVLTMHCLTLHNNYTNARLIEAVKVMGEGEGVPMWNKETSGLGNVYLSIQYTNMPDRIIKTIAAKTIAGIRNRLQECEQNFQVRYENSSLIRLITSHRNWKRKRNNLVHHQMWSTQVNRTHEGRTNVWSSCTILNDSRQKHQNEKNYILSPKIEFT